MNKNESYKSIVNKSLTKIVSIGIMSIAGISSVFSVFASNKRITILCDGNRFSVNTGLLDAESILEHQNIKIDEDDVVLQENLPETDGVRIVVKRAYDVPIIVDGVKISVKMVEGTVRDAIEKANISLDKNDKVIPGLDANLFNGISLEVVRQKCVNLTVNGIRRPHVEVKKGLVKDALNQKNIIVRENDILNVSLEQELEDDMEIILDRVDFQEEQHEEKVPFKTVEEKSDSLFEGSTKIKTPGVEGIEEVVVSKKIVNGQLVEESVKSKTMKTEPQDEVKLIGTKKKCPGCASIDENKGIIKDENGNEFAFSKKLTGRCTAYTAADGARTSTGELAQIGRVAVNPNVIPYGSQLYICSEDGSFVYGKATASDTGGALMSGRALVDLFYPTESECINFGARTLAVYVR